MPSWLIVASTPAPSETQLEASTRESDCEPVRRIESSDRSPSAPPALQSPIVPLGRRHTTCFVSTSPSASSQASSSSPSFSLDRINATQPLSPGHPLQSSTASPCSTRLDALNTRSQQRSQQDVTGDGNLSNYPHGTISSVGQTTAMLPSSPVDIQQIRTDTTPRDCTTRIPVASNHRLHRTDSAPAMTRRKILAPPRIRREVWDYKACNSQYRERTSSTPQSASTGAWHRSRGDGVSPGGIETENNLISEVPLARAACYCPPVPACRARRNSCGGVSS